MAWAETWAGMQPWQRAGVDTLTRTVAFGVATTMFAAFNGKPLGPWLAATAVVAAMQARMQWRRHRGGDTGTAPPALTSKRAVLSWVGLAAVFTSERWFPPVYRAVPVTLWVVLMIVAAVWGVWRWIAFFMNSPSKP